MRTQIQSTTEQDLQQEMSICPLIGATILFTIAEGLQVSATVCEVSVCRRGDARDKILTYSLF